MNFYSENDRGAAAWLRELIKAGQIPDGVVDERSITDVPAADLAGFTGVHLFAGIGGWPYALRLAGWPDGRPVFTGSCPCQPFSAAGLGKGERDERHLWPIMRKLIAERGPSICFGEQVASKAGREWLARVRADLEELGYGVGAADLCAAGIGAPHIRQRLFWVADAGYRECGRADECQSGCRLPGKRHQTAIDAERCGSARGVEHPASVGREPRRAEAGERGAISGCGLGGLGDSDDAGQQGRGLPDGECGGERTSGATGSNAGIGACDFWQRYDLIPCRDGKARRVEPGTFPLAHGVSGRVGLLRGYGNAIVPQLAAQFVAAFLDTEGGGP